MSVLQIVAGEEIEFNNLLTGMASDDTLSYMHRDYTRGYLRPRMVSEPVTGTVLADTWPITPVTNLWLSLQLYQNVMNANMPNVGLASSSTAVGGVFIGRGTGDQQLSLFTIKSDGTVTKIDTEAGNTFLKDILSRIDMHITSFNNASANVKVYLNKNVNPA